MKTNRRVRSGIILRISLTTALGCAVVWFAGCRSAPSGYRKSTAAALGVQSAAAEVQAESRALELAMGSLKDLVNEPPAELKQPFQHFSAAVDRLVVAAARTDDTGRRMAEKGAAYFQAWDQQIKTIDYEHIRDLSQARKVEVANRFGAVHQRYQECQGVVQPLIAYLQDVRRALSADLTPGGLESMKSVVQNADANAAKTQTALSALVAELSSSGTRMSSVAMQSVTGEAAQGGGESP